MADNLKYLNDSNFKDTISKGVTMVDFFAEWCGPCKTIAPAVEELANDLQGKATVAKLDIDGAQQTTSDFGVTSIPTIILFKDGKEANRVVGVKDKNTLKGMIEALL